MHYWKLNNGYEDGSASPSERVLDGDQLADNHAAAGDAVVAGRAVTSAGTCGECGHGGVGHGRGCREVLPEIRQMPGRLIKLYHQ